MRRGMTVATLLGLVLLGVILVLVIGSDRGWNLVGVLWIVLGGLFTIGLIVRFVRAEPGMRIRETFGPIVDAGDVYQKHLMGRQTGEESMREASNYVSRDKYSSEEWPER